MVLLTSYRGVGARALSNGINSAVFFCFFEALRATFAQKKQEVQSSHPPATTPIACRQRLYSLFQLVAGHVQDVSRHFVMQTLFLAFSLPLRPYMFVCYHDF